tara:strand:- start:254 stop:718 length:465 start_codon:yes stop_codon:yes gene_type:complete
MKFYKMKKISRRDATFMIGAFSTTMLFPIISTASTKMVSDRIKEITNGSGAKESDLFLDLPEIAENGNQVKVSFEIDSPMTDKDFVKEVYILADGNPAPNVAKFTFTPAMGSCSATTRIRLSKTQNVHLLAAYNNGNYAITKSKVKVTIGGCGG